MVVMVSGDVVVMMMATVNFGYACMTVLEIGVVMMTITVRIH
jgi:hypothetical protein